MVIAKGAKRCNTAGFDDGGKRLWAKFPESGKDKQIPTKIVLEKTQPC